LKWVSLNPWGEVEADDLHQFTMNGIMLSEMSYAKTSSYKITAIEIS